MPDTNMSIDDLYNIFLQSSGVETDSRKVGPNSLFFALKGERFNGNDFAAEVLNAGARFVVVDEPRNLPEGKYYLTTDVLATLQELAKMHRLRLGLPVVGITGSNGKTTSKELIHSVLSKKYKVASTRGNLNNHIGVPLTLLSFDQHTQIGIVEMGANHPGEIAMLCEIAMPDCGLITNIGKAHLEGFGGLDGVIRAKSELYRFLQSHGGTIFLHGDNPILTTAAGEYDRFIYYGSDEKYDVCGSLTARDPYLNISISLGDDRCDIETQLVGDYNLDNVLAAAVIGHFFGVDLSDIRKGIEEYLPSNHRSQLVAGVSNRIIMDAYNANPSSMQASIQNFLQLSADGLRKVMILGDMLELGAYSAEEHQSLTNFLGSLAGVDVYLVGPNFVSTSAVGSIQRFEDVQSVFRYISANPITNAHILLKGSRGIQLERLLELLAN